MKSHTFNIKRTHSGFTLVEVIVVLALIAILSTIGIPSIMKWMPAYRLKSAATDLRSNIQKARTMAIKQNTPIEIRFDTTNSPGFYYFDTTDDNVYTAGEFRTDLSSYGQGIDFGSGNATSDWNNNVIANATPAGHITFGTQGTADPFCGTVYLENSNADRCWALDVLITGTLKIRKYSGITPFNVTSWKP